MRPEKKKQRKKTRFAKNPANPQNPKNQKKGVEQEGNYLRIKGIRSG